MDFATFSFIVQRILGYGTIILVIITMMELFYVSLRRLLKNN